MAGKSCLNIFIFQNTILFSIWGSIIPQSFVLPNDLEKLKSYGDDFDKNNNTIQLVISFIYKLN